LNARTATGSFEIPDNMRCYSVRPARQIERLQFTNISKCFSLKSCGTISLFFLRAGEKITHFMGLPCVNLYFYVSESVSMKFEPLNILQE
jgi:hypothetical protein